MEPYRQYFADTEHAMISLFENLNFYLDILRDVQMPIFTSETSDKDLFTKEYEDWVAQNKNRLSASIEKEKEYFGHSVSMGTICGSILQIAFMAILKFSSNKMVPEQLHGAINEESKVTKFCIGESIRGVPKGLIIYAGRNQYNHMDEATFNKYTTYVFDRLAVFDTTKKIIDPAFQLSQPKIENYATNIVAILGWKDYESYITDILEILEHNSDVGQQMEMNMQKLKPLFDFTANTLIQKSQAEICINQNTYTGEGEIRLELLQQANIYAYGYFKSVPTKEVLGSNIGQNNISSFSINLTS